MIEQSRPLLEYSALLFFNILCILGIIAILLIIFAIAGTRRGVKKTLQNLDERSEALTSKGLDTMDAVQEAAFSVAESGFSIFEIFNFLRQFGSSTRRRGRGRRKEPKGFFEQLFNRKED
jgi:hypothetical protein